MKKLLIIRIIITFFLVSLIGFIIWQILTKVEFVEYLSKVLNDSTSIDGSWSGIEELKNSLNLNYLSIIIFSIQIVFNLVFILWLWLSKTSCNTIKYTYEEYKNNLQLRKEQTKERKIQKLQEKLEKIKK